MAAGPMFQLAALRRRKANDARRRRLCFENLETRLTLDGGLTNVPLSAVQRQSLLDGLQDVALWSDTLSRQGYLAQTVSVVNQSIGQELNVRSIFENQIVSRIAAVPTVSTDDLVSILKSLNQSNSGLTIDVHPATIVGGRFTSTTRSELQFQLTLDAVRTLDVSIALGSTASPSLSPGLSLDPGFSLPLSSLLHFEFTFGIDLAPGLDPSQSFFVRINSLSEGMTIQSQNWNAPAKVGLLGVQVAAATIDLSASVNATVINPDSDTAGNITRSELRIAHVGQTAVSSLHASIPLVATLGSTTFGGLPKASIDSNALFDALPLEVHGNSAYEELLQFTNISAENLLTVLDRVATSFQSIAPSLDVNESFGGLPYLSTQTSKAIDIRALVDQVTRELYDPILTALNPIRLFSGNRLSNNANFIIRTNDADSISVTLLAANQQVNENIDRFFNRSLPPSLAGRIVVSQQTDANGSFLFLKATDPKIRKMELIVSDRNSPITQNLGFEPSQFSKTVFRFDTFQSFASQLAQRMGIPTSQVDPQYDPTRHALSFSTHFQGLSFSQTVPLSLDHGLGPITILSTSTGTLQTTPVVDARIGLELSGIQTVPGAGIQWNNHISLGAGAQLSIATHVTDASAFGAAAVGILPVTVVPSKFNIASQTQASLNSTSFLRDLQRNPTAMLTVAAPTIAIAGHFQLQVDPTLGVASNNPATFDLLLTKPNQVATKLLADAAGPLNGQLSSSATFNLTVGKGSPVTINVPSDPSNKSLDDLIEDINSAIAGTHLGHSVLAGREGSRLILSTSGFDTLKINSNVADPTQTLLHWNNTTIAAAIGWTGNAPFQERIAPLAEFDASDFAQSVEGLLDLFQAGLLSPLTSKIPLVGLSTDDMLGITQKFKSVIQELKSKSGLSLKLAAQGIVSNLRAAIRGLPSTLSSDATEDLETVFALLRTAADVAETPEMARAIPLASTLIASVIPLTRAITKVNLPGVNIIPLNNVLDSLNHVTPTLFQLPTIFANALGSGSATAQYQSSTTNQFEQSMLVRANWVPSISRSVSLGSINLPNGLGPLKFDANSSLNLNVQGDFHFDFGYNFATLTPFLLDTSRFQSTALFSGVNSTYSGTIGGVSVTLGIPSSPNSFQLNTVAGGVPARLAVTVLPTDHNLNIGTIAFSKVASSNLNFQSVDAKLVGKFPVFLLGNNQGNVTVDWVFPTNQVASAPTVTAPANLIPALQSMPYNFNVLTRGIDAWNHQLELLVKHDILGQLPLIDGSIDISSGFMAKMETSFLSAVTSAIDVNNGLDSSQMRLSLFEKVQSALSSILVTNSLAVSQTNSPEIRFEIAGRDTYHSALRLGLAGLNMELYDPGDVSVQVDYRLKLGFGLSKTEGFYFLVIRDPADPAGSQFQLIVNASLSPQSRIASQLFSLPVVAQSNVDSSNRSLTRFDNAGVDIRILDPDNHITIDQVDPSSFSHEFQILIGANGLDVHTDLHLAANSLDPIHGDIDLPGIVTDLRVDQHFAPRVTLDDSAAIPVVELDNISLSLGSSLSKIIKPIVDQVNAFLAPIKPIILALDAEVPVLSDLSKRAGNGRLTWIDAVALYSDQPNALEVSQAMHKIADLVRTLSQLSNKADALSNSANSSVVFGDYHFLPSVDLRFAIPSLDPRSAGVFVPRPGFNPTTDGRISDYVRNTDRDVAVGTFLGDDLFGDGVRFPIFEDPWNVVPFLFGKDVTIVDWHLPSFVADFDSGDTYLGTIPVGPVPVNISAGLNFGIGVNVGVGFDTRGLREGHSFSDGFFFVDDGRGSPAVVSLTAGVHVSAAVGIPYVAEVGVQGKLTAGISAYWNNDDGDDRVHLDELLDHVAQGPECIFDLTGDLTAQLFFYIDTPLKSITIPVVPPITLFEYTESCPPLPPPELAHISDAVTNPEKDYSGATIPSNVLVLNIGPNAGLRVPGHSVDEDERVHVYQYQPGLITVTGFGQVKQYGDATHPISSIYADAGLGNNAVLIDASVSIPTTLVGGIGNDLLRGGSATNHLVGRSGDDVLIGGIADDFIEAGYGDAKLYGGPGRDRLSAFGGTNYLDGGDDDDFLQGGSTSDVIEGGAGNDSIFGGGGADAIFGQDGNDTIVGQGTAGDYIEGGPGNNSITGSDGPDVIWASRPTAVLGEAGRNLVFAAGGDDVVHGGIDNFNELHGGSGADTISAGTFGDLLFGDAGNDVLLGNDGNDIVHAGSGDDFVYGSAGDDTLYADSGTNTIYGGIGNDTIFGSSGLARPNNWPSSMPPSFNTEFAGPGDDTIFGELGIDTIYGGVGSAIISAGPSNDFIYGGTGIEAIHADGGDDFIKTGDGNQTLFGDDGNDLLVQDATTNQTLSDSLLIGRGRDPFHSIERVQLTDNSLSGGISFDVSQYTGPATLFGSVAGNDTVTVVADADMTLANGSLTTNLGGRFLLDRISNASLAGIRIDNVIDVSLWSGTAKLIGGSGLDRVIMVGDANMRLTENQLTRSTGGTFSLQRIQRVTLGGGASDNILDATGFAGDVWLYGGSGNDRLVGGSGNDYLDGGTGTDNLDGGAGDDTLTAIVSSASTLSGGDGDDLIYGSEGVDSIIAGLGRDRVFARGGKDSVNGGPGDDILDGGNGDDMIFGDEGSDLIVGADGNDVLYGFNTSSGDDGAINYLYGDVGTAGNEANSGDDVLHGGIGNDQLFGEGGTNTILAGGSGSLVFNTTAIGLSPPAIIPPPPVPSPANWPPKQPGQTPSLPEGFDQRGRWVEYASSATGGGLSNSPSAAVEASVAVGATGQFVAWADERTGKFQIYLGQHTVVGWQQLGLSSQSSGISNTPDVARRPSVTLDASGLPIVAWTQFNGTSSDIFVARYDALTNGGRGGWIQLGNSLAQGGVSQSGHADQSQLVMTSSGPTVAWLDTTNGVVNVYVRRFENNQWIPLGAGSASSSGVSLSANSVADLSLASDGNNVAVAWSQTLGSKSQIYLREYDGTQWNARGGSASGLGLSATTGNAKSASVAYLSGRLYVAWRDNSSGSNEIYVATFDGNQWVSAGDKSNKLEGVSKSHGDATQPRLSSGGGQLILAWADNRIANNTGNNIAIYSRRWNGNSFVEELPGDASDRGIGNGLGNAISPAIAVDAAGHPFVAWSDNDSGSQQIYFRANTFDLGTIHYVNDSDSQVGDSLSNRFATRPGANSNDGLSPATPKRSLQDVFQDLAHPVNANEVILIDAGTYSDSDFIDAPKRNILIIGSTREPAVLRSLILRNTAALTIQGISVSSGIVAIANSDLTLVENNVASDGVNLIGGTRTQVIGNRISPQSNTIGVNLTGSEHDSEIAHNELFGGVASIAITGLGASNINLIHNRLTGGQTGILLPAPASGHIANNRIEAIGVGVELLKPFVGLIDTNSIAQSQIGIHYATPALLGDNRVHDNVVGIATDVDGTLLGLGYFGSTTPNRIYQNGTGVVLHQASIQNQWVFGNDLGVAGFGSVRPIDFEHANVIERNSTGVNILGEVRFNRIARNGVGVRPTDHQLIANNSFFGNNVGIGVQSTNDVRVVNNTMVTMSGDNIRLSGGASETEIRNNVLWSGLGYDIYVANDSTSGFFSDFNDLHSTQTGKLVFWTKDFNDILDWQSDVHQFDLHSIGRTEVHPLWSQPQLVSLALNDFRIFDETARQRFTSPTIDLADARSDLALPINFNNLLTNPGFESGLTGWTASPSGSTQASNPRPWQGTQNFSSSANSVTSLEQRVDFIAAGFLPTEIDSQNLSLIFGGRTRSGNEATPDSGSLALTFFDSQQQLIATHSVSGTNAYDRWELIGDRVNVPIGARSAALRYTSIRRSGATNDAYFDGAFVSVVPNTRQPNLGADGNTAREVAQNINQHIVLLSPDLYTDWLRDAPLNIRWDSFGNTRAAPVRIDLYQDGPEGPKLLLNIAANAADQGSFTWIAANSGLDYGMAGLRIRVSIVGNESISDRSTETFTIPENTHTYFVNDNSLANDELVSNLGSNRNTGRLAERPKPYLNNILRIYSLGPTDSLHIDTGTYPALYPTVVSPVSGVGDDAGFLLTGPSNPNRVATLSIANPLKPFPAIDLFNAGFVTIQQLSLSDGTIGIWGHDGTENLVLNKVNVHDNSQQGLRLDSRKDQLGNRIDNGSLVADLGNSIFLANSTGIFIDGLVGRIHHNNVSFSRGEGIHLINPGVTHIEANTIEHNSGIGIEINNNGFFPTRQAIIGNADLSLSLGNIIDDNRNAGIQALGTVAIVGNNISNTRGDSNSAISGGTEVAFNVLHDNFQGVFNAASVHNNRVYHNSGTGIFLSGLTYENVVYSNDTGIETTQGLHNNLVYGNVRQGIVIDPTFVTNVVVELVNNTVYQPQGDAIRIERSTPNVHLRNNILWTLSGYDLSVDATSQAGFFSDNNLLYTTSLGKVALWQGAAAGSLALWRNAALQDLSSIAQDPLFVNLLGPDNVLGFSTNAIDGRDDDFHEQSAIGSAHRGSFAPVVSATRFPVFQSSAFAVDLNQSPAIDRGAQSDSFSNEPLPNGGFINLGAFGNTNQASLSPSETVLVTNPDGAETWPQGRAFPITWRSQDTSSTVKIELLRSIDGSSIPTVALVIATNAPNNGSFSWTVPATVAPASDYLIRVTRNDNSLITDTSNHAFAISQPINVYYVNDAAVNAGGGDWTTNPGSNLNDGLTAATPKASISAVLAAYQLSPGDVIRVDDGNYPLSANIKLTPALSGVTIEGYHDISFSNRHAQLDRGNKIFGSYVFEEINSIGTTLDHLWLTGGFAAVFGAADAASTGLTISNNTIFGNESSGIQLLAGVQKANVISNSVFGTRSVSGNRQQVGLQADGNDTTIAHNTIHDSASIGIQALGARAQVTGNEVYFSGQGIVVGVGTFYTPLLRSFVSDNLVHDNSIGIQAGGTTNVSGNEVYGQKAFSTETGIRSGDFVESFDNVVHDNSIGISGGGSIHDNRVFQNTFSGIQSFGANGLSTLFGFGVIYGNTVYLNQTGIELFIIQSSTNVDTVRNNLVYSNSAQGIYLHGAHLNSAAELFNNTVYQDQGNAIRVENNFANAHLHSNILWSLQGSNISVDATSELGFQSDYNNLYTTGAGSLGSWEGHVFLRLIDWSYELGLDRHSLSIDPAFAKNAGADATQFDFHLKPISPSIDTGSPTDYFLSEPIPNGSRVDQGAYGNSSGATNSPIQLVQVLSPNGFEKYQVGSQVTVAWHSDGLAQTHPVAMIDAGSSVAVDGWSADTLKRLSTNLNNASQPITHAIDKTGVAHAVATSIYQSFAEAPATNATQTGSMSYSLAVPDGAYTVRLHFVEPSTNAASIANFRRFDIQLQGATALAGYNIYADAGAVFKATEKNFNLTATGNKGISLSFISNLSTFSTGAIVSAIEVLADNPNTTIASTFDVSLSGNAGESWQTLATRQPSDAYGSGTFSWSIPNDLPLGDQYLVRVVSNDAQHSQGVSLHPFQITNAGNNYYVNDNSIQNDEYTTQIGDNANSGKSPSAPMASLQSLLNNYRLQPGDTVFVDTGNYPLVQNVALGVQHSGIRIQGPVHGTSLFQRGLINAQSQNTFAFDLQHATNVTLNHLSITGAYVGINLADGSSSTGLTVSNSVIFGNVNRGISIGLSNDRAIIRDNTLFGVPTGSSLDDQSNGIFSSGANDLSISHNLVYNSAFDNISLVGSRQTIADNESYGGANGILVNGTGTIQNNRVHNNRSNGINVSGAYLVAKNTVFGHSNAQQIGISADSFGAKIQNNTVYDNFDGIAGNMLLGNLAYHNSNIGIRATGTASENTSYSNGIGIRIVSGLNAIGLAANNLVYGNITSGIQVGAVSKYQILNNTVYQPVGDALRFEGDDGTGTTGLTTDVSVRNNALWALSGYDIVVPASAEGGLVSDFNDLYTTGTGKLGKWQGRDFTDLATWFYETGEDAHSQTADPGFINPTGPDGILGYSILQATNRGSDDNFQVRNGSPLVDHGDPNMAFAIEPSPNGNRIDIGAYGNTLQSANSPVQTTQVTSPDPLQRLQAGQQFPIAWQSSGLTALRPITLVNFGGAAVSNWNADTVFTGTSTGSFSQSVDLSGVSDPAPQAVYQSYATSPNGTTLAYQMQVPDGSYRVRLHFVEPLANTFVGARKFDIQLQGIKVLGDFDIRAAAGAPLKALSRTFLVDATAGGGIALLLSRTGFLAPIVSGFEIVADDPYGVAGASFNVELSPDSGANWSLIATDQTVDRFGRGSYMWTVPSDSTLGNQYLVRVVSNDGIHSVGISDRPFMITNPGHDYYVNDASLVGDVFSTTVGRNDNSGKSPDQPMANLAALISAYALGPGDVVHVDAGNYDLIRNVVLTSKQNGVRIEGPSAKSAILRRGVTGGINHFPVQRFGSVFELQQANNITLDHLSLTNAYAGIYIPDNSNSLGLSVSNNAIFGLGAYGVYLGTTNNFATIQKNSLFGIPGGTAVDDQTFSIYTSSNDAIIADNTIFDGNIGIELISLTQRSMIRGNEIYGNQYGIQNNSSSGSDPADELTILNNSIHNNSVRGIAAGFSRVIGNTVFGQTALNARGIEGGHEVANNVVSGNYDGIFVTTSGTFVHDNRVFGNAHIGMRATDSAIANRVYSNSIGIQIDSGFSFPAAIDNNIVYSNTNVGILLSNATFSSRLDVVNNTVYQLIGDAIRLTGSAQNVRVRNNILWVEAGYDLSVATSSQSGFSSDYNLLFKGTDPSAHLGIWNNIPQDSLAGWRAISTMDAHSLNVSPRFVDRDGADNVLGFTNVSGTPTDGGADDNFYLRADSPGIDVGYSWTYAVDAAGFTRRDEVATPNQGSANYVPSALPSSLFAAVGSSNSSSSFSLPFSFLFYDASYSSIQISRQGYLALGTELNNTGSDLEQFQNNRRIAPLLDSSLVYRNGDDVFIDSSVADQVTIRWRATNPSDDSPVNFAAVLFRDGRVRFDYGSGNRGLHPIVGISLGSHRDYLMIDDYHANPLLTDAHSVLVAPGSAGFSDLGAYEFRGNSLDVLPPTIVSTFPLAIGNRGDISTKLNSIDIVLNEEPNALDALANSVYELRKAGANGFGSSDDVVYSLSPTNIAGSAVVSLQILGLIGRGLPVGNYRFTVVSNANTSLHDLAGLRLDGDANGSEGGNYVREFSVVLPVSDLSVAMTIDSTTPSEGMLITYVITLSHVLGSTDATGIRVLDQLPNGLQLVSSIASSGSYDGATGIWNVGGLAFGVSETLQLIAKIPVGQALKTFVNQAQLTLVDQGDVNANNDTAAIRFIAQPSVDLGVRVEAFDRPAEGDILDYMITLEHLAGNTSASSVQITNQLPNGVRFLGAVSPLGTTFDPITGVWIVGTLAPATSRQLLIHTQVIGAALSTLANHVSISSSFPFDYKPSNNDATVFSTIVDAPLFATGRSFDTSTSISFTEVVAKFTDRDPSAKASYFNATIHWGDATSSAGSIVADGNGGFQVIGTHSYSQSKLFEVKVDIIDFGGTTATTSSTINTGTSNSPWHNFTLPEDVDGDQSVSPLDVLVIINYINRFGSGAVTSENPPPYLDVDNDNFVSPLDVLTVINYINARGNGEGEGSTRTSPTMACPISTHIKRIRNTDQLFAMYDPNEAKFE